MFLLFSCSKIANIFQIYIFLILLFFVFSNLQVQSIRFQSDTMKRNIALRESIDSNSSETIISGTAGKKLRRLPHVFGKVLELPFRSDADVEVEETAEFFKFVAEIDLDGGAGAGAGVRAQAVEIHPGVTKIVVRNGVDDGGKAELLLLDQLKVDTWRFRLPGSTQPEMATASFDDGELIVTVPKGCRGGGEFDDNYCHRRLILVQ